VDFCGGIFSKNFTTDNRITIMLITGGLSLISEIINYFCQVLLFKLDVELIMFAKIILIEALYNIIIIIIIYPLIIKAGEALKRIFKGKEIFTRYY